MSSNKQKKKKKSIQWEKKTVPQSSVKIIYLTQAYFSRYNLTIYKKNPFLSFITHNPYNQRWVIKRFSLVSFMYIGDLLLQLFFYAKNVAHILKGIGGN